MVGFSSRVFLCIVVFVVAITQPCRAQETKQRSEEVTNSLVLGVKHILDELIEDVRLAKLKNSLKVSVQNSSAIVWDARYRVDGEEQINTTTPEDDSPNAVGMLVMSEFVLDDEEPDVPPQDNFKTTVQGLPPVPVRSWQENETQVAINADTDTLVPQEYNSPLLQVDALVSSLNITDNTDVPVIGEALLPSLDIIDNIDILVIDKTLLPSLDSTGETLLPSLDSTDETLLPSLDSTGETLLPDAISITEIPVAEEIVKE